MKLFLTLLSIVVVIGVLVLLISYICFRMAFYVPRNKPEYMDSDVIKIPKGKIYEPYRASMEQWIREARAMPKEEISITSFDGLKLRGCYYEFAPDAPIELMFHGYRGNAESDLSGGIQRCFQLGHSALIVDQRCSGGSGGHVISFGVNEHRDCLAWIDFMLNRFGPDVRIFLCGISMGAATVLMATQHPLPENVVGVLADCGYTSAREIIKKVIRQMGLPVDLSYPFVKLGARLYGHFDLEETSPLEAMAKCSVPVIFFHGEADDFVPCDMSRTNYEACAARKRLVTTPGAGHGLCYLVDSETYLNALQEFFGPEVFQNANG